MLETLIKTLEGIWGEEKIELVHRCDKVYQTYNYETGEYDYDTYYLTAIIDDNYDWWSMEYESIVNYLNSQEDLISTTIESVYGNQIETIGNGFNSTFVSLEEDDLPF